MAIIFVIGAFLFSIHYKLPAIASLPLMVLALVLTFFLEEPYKNSKKLNWKNSMKHLKEGISYFKKSDVAKYIAFLLLFSMAAINIVYSLSSIYLEKIFIPISLIGVIAFIASMITAFSSKKAHKWEEKLKEKKSMRLVQVLIVLCIFLMSFMIPYFGVLIYFLVPFAAGFFGVVMGDYINKRIASTHRATLLSIQNFFGNLGIFILFPFIGFLAEFKSMGFSFLVLGLIVLIGYFLVFLYSRAKGIKFKS